MIIRDGGLYLGSTHDGHREFHYDVRNLRTHAMVVGMTGSGKTGLCIAMLEELSMKGIPSILIDPKGDLSNLMLAFPKLRAEDFKPWVHQEDAERQSISLDELAKREARKWAEGLDVWGVTQQDMTRYVNSVEHRIYTPASRAGIPISVLASFDAPGERVRNDPEALRERVNTTVASLLGLLGVKSDPVKDREAILLATLLMHSWQKGMHTDLYNLVNAILEPPMKQFGAIHLDDFYPPKDRKKLAVKLNNLLASPGFASWMEGEPLDIQSLLYAPDGSPRCSVMSIAHLSEPERMFFVSLLLNEYVAWMRTQPGNTDLRSVLYMDEIAGYLPPTKMPPSKQPMLTLLKQARAFGCGVVLATQNPVDLDYKALSNMGTWFIGKLQTPQDKSRLMDGLEGSDNPMPRRTIERTLSGLGARKFAMHSIHVKGMVLFETRWCMSYLTGPMTREQIKSLMRDRVDTKGLDIAQKWEAFNRAKERYDVRWVDLIRRSDETMAEVERIKTVKRERKQRQTMMGVMAALFSRGPQAVRIALQEPRGYTKSQVRRLEQLGDILESIDVERTEVENECAALMKQQAELEGAME